LRFDRIPIFANKPPLVVLNLRKFVQSVAKIPYLVAE